MKRVLPLLALLAAPLAMAHPGHAETATFLDGFMHPFTGIDHLLAMLAVGLWSAGLNKGRPAVSVWIMPAVFVFFLLNGILLDSLNAGLPAVEPMIAVSLLVLGLAAGISKQVPQAMAWLVVGVFATFHGYAHGAELVGSFAAIAGIVLATALLHAAGIALGLNAMVNRAAAAVVTSGGVFFLLQLA